MKVSLIGYGKMGQLMETLLIEKGHEIVSKIDPNNPDADFKEITADAVEGADVCIDFTHPSCVLDNIKKVTALGKNMVVATTGWYNHVDDVKELVKQAGIGFIYASNFSLGVNIFYKMVEDCARTINKFSSYDISGIEFHHNRKADSPSGTAKSIAKILEKNIDRKTKLVYEMLDRKIKPDELHFASMRVGNMPGTHKIFFDSDADTIELAHTARNRKGFAAGAILAAEWIIDKTGFFTIADLMKEVMG